MADQGPYRFPQPGYSQEDYTPQSTVRDLHYSELSFNLLGPTISEDILCSQWDQVSSFNLPMVYSASTLTTPVLLTMESSLNATKFPPPHGKWDNSQPMNYPHIMQRDTGLRMKSNSKDRTLSVGTPAFSEAQGLGITRVSFLNSYDPPAATGPYTNNYAQYSGASGPGLTSPATSTSYASTPGFAQPSTPIWNPQPPTTQYTQGYIQAPILAQPSPNGFHRKCSNKVLKREPGLTQFPQRGGPMHHSVSPGLFDSERKNQSPPLGQIKPRKASDPSHYDRRNSFRLQEPYQSPQVFSLPNLAPQMVQLGGRSHSITSTAYGRMSQDPLSDNERFLMDLRCQEPALDWKKTARAFNERTGLDKKVPALQMMYTRSKEKRRLWTEKDSANSSGPYYDAYSPHSPQKRL